MRKHFILLPFLLLAAQLATAQNDALTRFFDKYMDDERFTVVYISPKMFQMVSKISTDDPEWEKTREVIADLRGLRVLTASDSLVNGTELYREAMSKVPAKEYEELLTVRDGNENVRIMIKESGNIIDELLLFVGAPDEFVALSFTGRIDLEKISKLGKSLDVQGAEHLDKIKAKQ